MSKYPVEVLDQEEDNGTMPANVAELEKEIVGHKIVDVRVVKDKLYDWGNYESDVFEIVLDNGKRVQLLDGGDCCAYTEVKSFLLNPDKVDHIITGIGTTDGYTTWHIYADLGDILSLTVGWSAGNPFYYGYGFDIRVKDIDEQPEVQ